MIGDAVNVFVRSAVSIALVCFPGAILGAQNRDDVLAKINQTRAYLLQQRTSPGYRDSVQRSILVYESHLDNHCKDVNLELDSVDVRDRILALLEVDDHGTAIAGSWRESIPGTACNEKRRFNVRVDVTRQGLRYTTTFPGDAAGNPELQNDTLKNIRTDLQIMGLSTKKSCSLEVVDTHLVGPQSTVQDNGTMSPWKESWDVRTCRNTYVVPVAYHPDSRGTAIEVRATDIKPQ